MGDTSFQTWKHAWDGASGPTIDTLQWGHVFSDVETGANTTKGKLITKLQWGHVFSDVETRGFPRHAPGGRCASMGPRLFRRGNSE